MTDWMCTSLNFRKNNLFWPVLAGLLFVITLSWGWKTFYFVHELDLNLHKKFTLLSSAGFALILASILTAKKNKLNMYMSLLIYILFSFLLYADVVYERYYDSILHLELIGQANQLGDVKDSILSLIFKTDYLYWIDIPFIFLAFFFANRMLKDVKSTWQTLTMMGVGITIILTLSIFPLKSDFSDQYKVSLTGVIPAHIFDLYHTLYRNTFANQPVIHDKDELERIRQFFKKNQDLQKESPYYGKFKNKNIIIVQAESLNTFPIGLEIKNQKVTPNIDRLIAESHYYPNIYLGIGRGNTSDAEFVANNSIYPIAQKGIYKGYSQNDYLSLPIVLSEAGYDTSATHGNAPEFWNRQQAYKKQGFQSFYHKEHPMIKDDDVIGLGISDESIFNQMVEIYKKKQQPFYNFIISLTNHRPFELPNEYRYLDLPGHMKNTATGNYLQSVKYFDKAIGKFIEELKEEGFWENTIFVLYGDHYGPIPKDAEEIQKMLDVEFDQKAQFNIPLIIHHPGQKDGIINQVTGSQMDIYPTLTSLLGIERPLIQFGTPLDIKHEGFAGFAYETTRYTYYSDQYDYLAAHDGVFESGTCLESESNTKVHIESCRKGYNRLFKDIETSNFLLENNLIEFLFGQ